MRARALAALWHIKIWHGWKTTDIFNTSLGQLVFNWTLKQLGKTKLPGLMAVTDRGLQVIAKAIQ